MEIAVTHPSLNIPGGAERLCLTVVEALQKKGHNVTLVTVEKSDWQIVERNFGHITMPSKEIYAMSNRLSKNLSSIPIASVYFLIYILQLLNHSSKEKYDLIINTFGDVVNSVADVTYVHFPLRAAVEYSQIPAFSNKPMWQAIAPLYSATLNTLDRIHPGELVTNSKFMQGIIKETLKRESLVVYPPVNVETFSRGFKNQKNGCTVAIVASYTPKRHLERLPFIAKFSKHAKFVVMGKADKYSSLVLMKLKKQLSELHVEDKVTLMTNVSFSEFLNKLSEAKVYLHVMPYDHFGISVVEAMASGCVPVVHRSGGPWQDILDCQQGAYGFSYTTPEQAAELIDMLVTDEDSRRKIASRSLQRARKFDKTVFMQRIIEVVEKVVK